MPVHRVFGGQGCDDTTPRGTPLYIFHGGGGARSEPHCRWVLPYSAVSCAHGNAQTGEIKCRVGLGDDDNPVHDAFLSARLARRSKPKAGGSTASASVAPLDVDMEMGNNRYSSVDDGADNESGERNVMILSDGGSLSDGSDNGEPGYEGGAARSLLAPSDTGGSGAEKTGFGGLFRKLKVTTAAGGGRVATAGSRPTSPSDMSTFRPGTGDSGLSPTSDRAMSPGGTQPASKSGNVVAVAVVLKNGLMQVLNVEVRCCGPCSA